MWELKCSGLPSAVGALRFRLRSDWSHVVEIELYTLSAAFSLAGEATGATSGLSSGSVAIPASVPEAFVCVFSRICWHLISPPGIIASSAPLEQNQDQTEGQNDRCQPTGGFARVLSGPFDSLPGPTIHGLPHLVE